MTQPTTPAPASSALRELIAGALKNTDYDLPIEQRHDLADAVIAAIQPGAGTTATLLRMSEADVQRVIDLYERWVKAGPPPLGTSVSRWWDIRLAELHTALNPTKEQ